MEFLHVADSATHLGASGVVASVVGIAAGAFLVFGLPALWQRRSDRRMQDGLSQAPEVVSPDGDDDTHGS